MEFTAEKRRALIVYVRNLRQVKQLRRYGNVEFISRKMHYVVIYMNETDLLANQEKIEKLGFVTRTEISLRPDLNPELADKKEDASFSIDNDEELENIEPDGDEV
ncbi:DUF2129 domain-containing protein [Periweissella cryptocerci]|uniref:DUF2129 domain-containing protein n=1 Tax=Periweissella cryptocerci TaxID=2506420 RepID=A0A4V1AIW1_9LACO|nr:YlbG family protein [Periweissella cryptocerci]QBO36885.1 DUF2129 domain-containing protein [Periweissella cryptocerci]